MAWKGKGKEGSVHCIFKYVNIEELQKYFEVKRLFLFSPQLIVVSPSIFSLLSYIFKSASKSKNFCDEVKTTCCHRKLVRKQRLCNVLKLKYFPLDLGMMGT